MKTKKIKSVKKGDEYFNYFKNGLWQGSIFHGAYSEFVSEEVILACPLFEIEYEEELTDLKKFYNTIQDICKDFENKKPGK